MSRLKGKPSDVSKALPARRSGELGKLSESHQMTLHRPIPVEGEGTQFFSTNPIEYHLTVRLTHETLSRRELSLLSEVVCYQIVRWGCSLNQYLVLSELYFRLLGSRRKASEVKDSKIRLTVLVSEILLRSLKNTELSLDSDLVVQIPEKTKQLLQPALMTSRTYGSRYKTWRPEKFFVVRTVPVDIQMLERRKDSEPYSGYCKGYGESHPSAHSKVTKPSQELDGATEEEIRTSEEHYLFERCTNPIHVLCEFLLIKYKIEYGKDL